MAHSSYVVANFVTVTSHGLLKGTYGRPILPPLVGGCQTVQSHRVVDRVIRN